jgi:DNA polymerase-3 subunit gamma/tau
VKKTNAPHLALTRKYRPQHFEDLVGQETVSTTLKNAVGSGQVAHAFLFFGPKGCGKTTTARILAKALNCRAGAAPTPKPCGECPACTEIAAGSSIDVLELDAASHTQVDKIREMIIETVSLAPTRDRYKVFIIDEVHMLSSSSFNALLKTLEEPPSHVVFILATTELAKIPATIVSRCQRFRFRPIGRETAAEHLRRVAALEKIDAEPKALELLARACGGSMRDAVSLLDQAAAFAGGKVTRAKVVDLMGMLPDDLLLATARAVLEKDAAALSGCLKTLASEGYDPSQLLRDLRERCEELYLLRLGVHDDSEADWKALAEGRTPETFSFLIRRLNRVLEEMRGSDTPQAAFEMGLYGLLESAYDLAQWVARLEAIEKRAGLEASAPEPDSPAPKPRRSAAEAVAPARLPSAGHSAEGTAREEKGTRAAAPAPKAAAPAPSAAPKPALPSAGSGKALSAEIRKAFLARVHEDKPSLGSALDGARIEACEGGCRLVFDSAFASDRAEKERAYLEKALAEAAGAPMKLSFAAEERPRSAAAEEPEWVDASSEDAPADPGLRKVLGVFGGRAKPVKKK